ncbi:MAG TPA: permease prefix domain 1-containing protein, partial [Gemmataceae bacterium]|nr:permease prefix domain 1-containing protein [Gemmataceae bacterium]
MGKLEHYLDQVCHGMGGPRSLRQHVRQELREHLLDAAAEHRAAGLSDEEALDRALADFGGPQELRSELEATHGYRLLPVVIDKALQ